MGASPSGAPTDSDRHGAIAGFVAMVILGSLFASADAIERYPLAAGQAIRCLLATLVLLAVTWRYLKLPARRDLGLIILLSITGVIGYNVAILLAVRQTDPSVVGVVVSCLPVVVAVISPVIRRRMPSVRIIGAALLVAAGAAAVQYTGAGTSLAGLFLAAGALALEALFAFLAVPLLKRIRPTVIAMYTCAFAVPICAIPALVFEGMPEIMTPTTGQVAGLLHLGLVVTPLVFALWYVAIERLGVERASLFFGVLPISVLLSAAVIAGTEVTFTRVAGIGLVVWGIYLGMRARTLALPPHPAHEPGRAG